MLPRRLADDEAQSDDWLSACDDQVDFLAMPAEGNA
jgi:hypothetical protein